MPENIRGILVYELICGIRARTVLVKRAPGLRPQSGQYWTFSLKESTMVKPVKTIAADHFDDHNIEICHKD